MQLLGLGLLPWILKTYIIDRLKSRLLERQQPDKLNNSKRINCRMLWLIPASPTKKIKSTSIDINKSNPSQSPFWAPQIDFEPITQTIQALEVMFCQKWSTKNAKLRNRRDRCFVLLKSGKESRVKFRMIKLSKTKEYVLPKSRARQQIILSSRKGLSEREKRWEKRCRS